MGSWYKLRCEYEFMDANLLKHSKSENKTWAFILKEAVCQPSSWWRQSKPDLRHDSEKCKSYQWSASPTSEVRVLPVKCESYQWSVSPTSDVWVGLPLGAWNHPLGSLPMPFSSFVRMCAKHLAMERTPLIKLAELERQLVCMGQGEPAGFVYPHWYSAWADAGVSVFPAHTTYISCC